MMNTISQKKTPEQMLEAIFALDLDPIKFKLMDKKEGQGWSREQADRNEREYKRFLALMAKFPDEPIVPNTDVDKFWHAHILDTMKYAEDCDRIFGYFVHHFPYFGMRDAEDAANLASAASATQRLYAQEFGEVREVAASYCVKADDKVNDKAGDKAVAAAGAEAAYCVRASGQAAEAAYCVRTAASYCVRASDKVADAKADAAYCVRAASSYCVRAESRQEASYCVRAGGRDIVTGKGRPTLEQAHA